METKDMVLLIGIPVLLIVMLFYLDKIPSITGAVAAAEENPKLGEYAIMPSFKAKIDYNLDEEYAKLKTKLKQIIDECKSQENIEDCIGRKTREDTEIQWTCEEKDVDILYDFVDKLKDCARLQQENVLCRFSLDRREYINKVKTRRTFEIKLTNWYPPRIKTELFEEGKLMATELVEIGKLSYSNNMKEPAINANSIMIKVLFNEGTPAAQEFYATTDTSPRVELSKLFLLYKPKKNEEDAAENAASVHFIDAAVESSFRAPPAKTISLPNTKGIKFCAKTGKKILAYDISDNTIKMRDIEYKFAVTFPKAVPKPLDKIEALDALKSENGIILKWSRPKQDDIEYYSIYYSESGFSDKKIPDVKKDASVKKLSADAENFIRIDDIDLSKCDFDPTGSPCKYSGFNSPLLQDKLYYVKSKDMLVYLVKDLADDKQYYFAVTALNSQGEISNDKTISGNTYVLSEGKNYIRATPLDDLAPGKANGLATTKTEGKTKITWKRPSKNIDGSDANDVSGYRIYYIKSISELNPQLELGHKIKQITAAEAKCDTVCEYPLENIGSLDKGQFYNFAAIPIDEKGNEYLLESERLSVKIE